MNQHKTKSLWIAGAAVAGVVAIAATVFVMVGPDTGDPDESDPQAIPRPSGPIPDYPDQAPEYDAEDCEYSELRVDGEVSHSSPADVSASGEYIAGNNSLDDPLWGPEGETIGLSETVIPRLDETVNVRATAVNSRGIVVGGSEGKTGQPDRGWVYDGDVVELTLPNSVDASDPSQVEVHPVGINEDGDIAGYVTVDSRKNNRSHTEHVPLRWDAGGGEATVLDAGGDGAEVAAITEDGAVIGVEFEDRDTHDGDPTNDHGEVWKWDRDGERETLPLSGGVIDIAGDWLLGSDPNGGYQRWNMAEEDDGEEVSLRNAAAIDTSGRVFGHEDDRAFIETDGEVEELPLPADDRDDVTYLVTAASANSGVIAGSRVFGQEEAEESNAVGWRCADTRE